MNKETLPFLNQSTLARLAISESGFIFDPATGHNYTVNETGLLLLRLFQKNNKINEIMASLVKEYNITQRDLERDIYEFAGLLREYINE